MSPVSLVPPSPKKSRPMPTFLLYILKSAVCLTLLYALYGLMLRRETFHRFNRLVLLAILAACIALPALRLTTSHPTAVNYGVQRVAYYFARNAVPAGGGRFSAEAAPAADAPLWPQVLVGLYIAGLIYYMSRYAFDLLSVVRLLRRGRFREECGGCRVVVANEVESPFSWMRWVVISEADLAGLRRVLLAHEAAHVRLRHSWDMLLCELVVRLQWFNPFGWLLREDLRALHEYQADSAAIGSGIDAKQYQMLLIKKAVGSRLMPAANSLGQTSLKQRFLMMYTAPSARSRAARSLLLLPLAACTVWAFAEPESVRCFVKAQDLRPIAAMSKPAARPVATEALPESMEPDAAPAPEEQSAVPDTTIWKPCPAGMPRDYPAFIPKDEGTGCTVWGLEKGAEVAFFLNRRRVSEAELSRHVTLHRSPDGRAVFAYIPKGKKGKYTFSACEMPFSRKLYGVDCPVIAVETPRATLPDNPNLISEPDRE